MDQKDKEAKVEAEHKADFAQQMPEQPAQPDALEQAIVRCDNTVRHI